MKPFLLVILGLFFFVATSQAGKNDYYAREVSDSGDEPKYPGCAGIYSDNACTKPGGNGIMGLMQSTGDTCTSQTTLKEYTFTNQCTFYDPEKTYPVKSYDCTKVVPNGICITVEDYCLPGWKSLNGALHTESAYCGAVQVPNPKPIPNPLVDYCACSTNAGETIVADYCATANPGDQCSALSCYVQVNGGAVVQRACVNTGNTEAVSLQRNVKQ